MVDAVTPWYPASKGPKNAKVISIAEEFPNSRLPYWGYNVDLALVAPPAATLGQLVKKAKAHRSKSPPIARAMSSGWRARASSTIVISASSKKMRKNTPTIRPSIRAGRCTPSAKALPANAVISEETTVYRSLIQEAIPREQTAVVLRAHHRRPRRRFELRAGREAGDARPAGLRAHRRRRVSLQRRAVLSGRRRRISACRSTVVVFNNGRYLSMETSLIKYFPDGAAKNTGVHFGAEIGPRPDYQHYAKAHGGYGYRVTNPRKSPTPSSRR